MAKLYYKWQVFAGESFVGETSVFDYDSINSDPVTHERWSLMSKAREMFPDLEFPGYEYVLVKAQRNEINTI